eukprot:2041674-Prymnesium_polylepis.1
MTVHMLPGVPVLLCHIAPSTHVTRRHLGGSATKRSERPQVPPCTICNHDFTDRDMRHVESGVGELGVGGRK